MPVDLRVPTAKLISVHEEPNPVIWDAPGVIPGQYVVPGIHASDEYLDALVVNYRDQGSTTVIRHPYAKRKEKFGITYIEIEVCEALAHVHHAGQQTHDEFGVPLVPDVGRMAVPVRANHIVNDIEARYGAQQHDSDNKPFGQGIVAIAGEEPTEAELREAVRRLDVWEAHVLSQMDENFERFGARMVTEQAKRIARKWHTANPPRLNPLPRWATVDPRVDSKQFKNCPHCGAYNRINENGNFLFYKCAACAGVVDWELGVNSGHIRPTDVPPKMRVAAGLESEPEPEVPVEVPPEAPPKKERARVAG